MMILQFSNLKHSLDKKLTCDLGAQQIKKLTADNKAVFLNLGIEAATQAAIQNENEQPNRHAALNHLLRN